jgi:predicted dehydrogenase
MKKLNVGIVGYGWAATAHIPAINAGALGQVTRICSSRSLDARELSAQHDCALQTGTDDAALLAEPNIQVAWICSHHRQRKEQAIAAARAGKHIIDHPCQTRFDAFFEAIEQGVDPPRTGLKEAALAHAVIFAADRSRQRVRPVELADIRNN